MKVLPWGTHASLLPSSNCSHSQLSSAHAPSLQGIGSTSTVIFLVILLSMELSLLNPGRAVSWLLQFWWSPSLSLKHLAHNVSPCLAVLLAPPAIPHLFLLFHQGHSVIPSVSDSLASLPGIVGAFTSLLSPYRHDHCSCVINSFVYMCTLMYLSVDPCFCECRSSGAVLLALWGGVTIQRVTEEAGLTGSKP